MEDEFSERLEKQDKSDGFVSRVKQEADYLRQFLTFEDAIQSLATYRVFAEDAKKSMRKVVVMVKESEASFLSSIDAIGEQSDICANVAESAIAREIDALDRASKRGKASADVLHNKPGGSREKRKQILDIWATGKFATRDQCAEQECAAIGLSFSKARSHLIGTPDNPKPN